MNSSQIRFELPVDADLGSLNFPDLGLSQHPLAGSESENDYSMEILDSADQRLLSWGVTLGFSAERGGWVLRAPRWSPKLPVEEFFSGSIDAMPDKLEQKVRPFLRQSEVAPITTRNVNQRVSALMNPVGAQLAEVVDRTIEVVLRGETALQYRELLISDSGLAPVQVASLRRRVIEFGGEEITIFPTLGNRLGVTNYPPAIADPELQMSVGDFVQSRLIRRWTEIVSGAVSGDPSELSERLAALDRDVRGLDWALKKSWRAQLSSLPRAIANPTPDNYFPVLEALDVAVKSGPVRGGDDEIGVRFVEVTSEALDGILETACAVEANSSNPKWRQAAAAADRAAAIVRVSRAVFQDRARKLSKRLAAYQEALVGCQIDDDLSVDLSSMTVEEAFAAGQRHQQLLNAVLASRADFLSSWMKLWQGIKKVEVR